MNRGCEPFRTALSARLDGEDLGLPAAELDAHLAGCSACSVWAESAERVTRSVRLQPVKVPDLTVPILAAIAAEAKPAAAEKPHVPRRRLLQIALGLSAALQLATALPMLLGLQEAAHTTREAASFDIALAVGFLLAARWPERARAFVPVAFVLAGCLTLTTVFDVVGGATMLAHEVSHIAALAQAGLLWALSRHTPQGLLPKPRQAAAS